MHYEETKTEEVEVVRSNKRDPKSRRSKPTHKKKNSKDRRKDNVKTSKIEMDTSHRYNDPSWYFSDKSIADQAASFSFNNYLGVVDRVNLSTWSASSTEGTKLTITPLNLSIPTIGAYQLNPSMGSTDDVVSGINLAGLKLYTTLSSVNAKTTQYQPNDLTLLIGALGEIISLTEHIRRTFGVAFTYNQRNRALPQQLIQSFGFDPEDFLHDLPQKRLQFNSIITAINKIPFLDNITYLWKCQSLYERVFMDNETNMAQVYVNVPNSTWIIEEQESDKGTILSTISLPTASRDPEEMKFSHWMDILKNMVNKLLTSSTLNFIYSDMINYSQKTGAKLMYLDYLREEYIVVPEFNPNYLMQMHNATIVGEPVNNISSKTNKYTMSNDVYSDVNTNGILYKPLFTLNDTFDDIIVDFPNSNPSVEDRIEATRYCVTFNSADDVTGIDPPKPYVYSPNLPDHYVTAFSLFRPGTGSTDTQPYFTFRTNIVPINAGQAVQILRDLTSLHQFDWSPIIYVVDKPQSRLNIMSDLTYYTYIDEDWLYRVNELAYQALYSMR